MKLRHIQRALAVVACAGILFPPSSFAAEPIARNVDVALRPGGVLVGQVVDQQGAVKAGAAVSLKIADQEVVRTTTDKNGVFAAKGLRGGQYLIVTADGTSLFRLWSPGTEPPAAQQAAMVVDGQSVVRGQWAQGYPGYMEDEPGGGFRGAASAYGHAWVNWVQAHPVMTASVVAAAVAAPIAIVSFDHGSHS